MKKDDAVDVVRNKWQALRAYTTARIALGRSGVSLPTDAHLAFQLAHARARDAVHVPLEIAPLEEALRKLPGVDAVLLVDSAATDRLGYLRRPDLGRLLSEAGQTVLQALQKPARAVDLALVIGDGLSPQAVNRQAPALLEALMPRLIADGWQIAPIVIVRQARVAIGDQIGALLAARMVVVLIGERPGLSAPDSMGLYLTWMPKPGLTDASRNCISNVRDAGLPAADAAVKLHYLLSEARRLELSGVALKDGSDAIDDLVPPADNFLLGR